jgi:hypothetical protein
MQQTWEVWNSLLEKPIDCMSEVERIIHRVNIFVIDFENGSWLYNIAPGCGEGSVWSELRALASAVLAIDVPTVASYLVEIAEIAEQIDVQIPREGGYWAAADPTSRVKGTVSANLRRASTGLGKTRGLYRRALRM